MTGNEYFSRGAFSNCGSTILSVGIELITSHITGNKFVVVFVEAPQKNKSNVRIHNKTADDIVNMLGYIPEGTT